MHTSCIHVAYYIVPDSENGVDVVMLLNRHFFITSVYSTTCYTTELAYSASMYVFMTKKYCVILHVAIWSKIVLDQCMQYKETA